MIVNEVERFTYESTIESIRSFLSTIPDAKSKIYMIFDNAPWHRKAKRLIKTDDKYADIKARIEFIDLPPYSPDLNPIEQVWRVTRRNITHNRFFSDIDKLRSKLNIWFKLFGENSPDLWRLCHFNFREAKIN